MQAKKEKKYFLSEITVSICKIIAFMRVFRVVQGKNFFTIFFSGEKLFL